MMQTYASKIIATSVKQSFWPQNLALECNVFTNPGVTGMVLTCRDTPPPKYSVNLEEDFGTKYKI